MTKIAPLFDTSPFLFAQTPAPAGLGGFSPMIIVVYGLLFAAFYFFAIAPQKKKQKEHQKMLESLTTGDEVITTGGIYGEITNKKEDRYVIRVAEGTKIEVGKGFIHTAIKKQTDDKK